MAEQAISKGQVWGWTAAGAIVSIAFSVFLQVRGLIPDWAGTAAAVIPIVLLMGDLEQRRKRGEKHSLPHTLWTILKAAMLTAAGVGFVLFLLAAEGFLFEIAGVVAVAFVALGIGSIFGWFPRNA